MYVKDVEYGKRTYTHIFAHNIHRVQYIVFDTFNTFDMSNITLYTVLRKSCKHHLRCLQHCFDLLYSISHMHSMLCMLHISTPPTSNKNKNVYWHVPFNVHTADKVTMSVDEWLPHYLIQSRSHSNSKG